jgi:hypothetical protein
VSPRSKAALPGVNHRHLAFAVLRQAIADATNPAAPTSARHSARQFLAAGNQMYRFWSTVATSRRPTAR